MCDECFNNHTIEDPLSLFILKEIVTNESGQALDAIVQFQRSLDDAKRFVSYFQAAIVDETVDGDNVLLRMEKRVVPWRSDTIIRNYRIEKKRGLLLDFWLHHDTGRFLDILMGSRKRKPILLRAGELVAVVDNNADKHQTSTRLPEEAFESVEEQNCGDTRLYVVKPGVVGSYAITVIEECFERISRRRGHRLVERSEHTIPISIQPC